MENSLFLLKIKNIDYLAGITRPGVGSEALSNATIEIPKQQGIEIIRNMAEIFNLQLAPSRMSANKNGTQIIKLLEEPNGPALM
jgi:hypothetical protein